ncbi:MAG: hypothetical protein R3C03_21160 [Pirellulaceae bacterium]
MDLVTGTIFQNNTQFNDDQGSFPQLLLWNLVTSNSNPDSLANGLLATITIDTTGYFAGETFSFEMGATLNGPTTFPVASGSIVPNITAGSTSLIAVPEPGLGGLSLLAVCIAMTSIRKRNRE